MGTRGGKLRRGTYRFVHASDLRLDAPVRGLARVPSPLHQMLRDASLQAWSALVDLSIQRGAAFVVIAGGLFDGEVSTLRACAAVRRELQRLRAHGIDAVIAMTPADVAAAPERAVLTDGAALFDSGQWSTTYVRRDGDCLAAVHGVGCDGADARQLMRALRATGTGVEIGVLPAALPNGLTGGAPAWLTGVLSDASLDYWALGGSPQHAVLHPAPLVVLPGTPQGRGFEPGDLGAKGCVVVEVEDGCVGGATFESLNRVRFASVEVDVGGCADRSALRRRLGRAVEGTIGDGTERAWIVEAVLRGRLNAGVARDRVLFAAELLDDLNRHAVRVGTTVWWGRVLDHTSGHDRPDDLGADDLRRAVSAQSEALGAPMSGSTFLAQTFAPLLRRWDAESDLVAQRELVRDAAAVALDALAAEESR